MSIKKKFRILFKQIIEKIFLIIYPKPYSISHDYKIFKVKIKSDKKKTLFKIFQITNCKIYTDTLYNVTYIKNNMILSNISRQLSPKGFYLHNNCNNVLKKGTPNIKKKLKGPILSLIQGASGHNYFHFLFDIVPKLLIVNQKFDLKYFRFIYLPELRYPFQEQIIKSLGIDKKKIIDSKKIRHIETDKVIVPQHPYFNEGEWWKKFNKLPYWIIYFLRKEFINLKKKTRTINNIFIDRSDTKNNHNKIYNEKDLDSFLKINKFSKIKLREFSFFQQIFLFNNAKCIIGPHGAGFANIIFCKKKTFILDIKDKSFKSNTLYKKISAFCNLKYFSYQSEKKIDGKMVIDVKKIKKIIKDNIKLKIF